MQLPKPVQLDELPRCGDLWSRQTHAADNRTVDHHHDLMRRVIDVVPQHARCMVRRSHRQAHALRVRHIPLTPKRWQLFRGRLANVCRHYSVFRYRHNPRTTNRRGRPRPPSGSTPAHRRRGRRLKPSHAAYHSMRDRSRVATCFGNKLCRSSRDAIFNRVAGATSVLLSPPRPDRPNNPPCPPSQRSPSPSTRIAPSRSSTTATRSMPPSPAPHVPPRNRISRPAAPPAAHLNHPAPSTRPHNPPPPPHCSLPSSPHPLQPEGLVVRSRGVEQGRQRRPPRHPR